MRKEFRNAIVVAGTNSRRFVGEVFSVHVDDPQFSYRSINGEDGESILPALMISTIHPSKFKDQHSGYRFSRSGPGTADDKIVLIPPRSHCRSATDVIALVERLFEDIEAKKPLTEFAVAKEIRAAAKGGAYSDALILKPSMWGMGVDLKALLQTWRTKGARE